jgi:hypothetical protein
MKQKSKPKEKTLVGWLLYISIAGYNGFSEPDGKEDIYWALIEKFKNAGIHITSVDTIPGWFNLNQDWIQVYVPYRAIGQHYRVELTDWWPQDLKFLLDEGLESGLILMQVKYLVASKSMPKKDKQNHDVFRDQLIEKLAQDSETGDRTITQTIWERHEIKIRDYC